MWRSGSPCNFPREYGLFSYGYGLFSYEHRNIGPLPYFHVNIGSFHTNVRPESHRLGKLYFHTDMGSFHLNMGSFHKDIEPESHCPDKHLPLFVRVERGCIHMGKGHIRMVSERAHIQLERAHIQESYEYKAESHCSVKTPRPLRLYGKT